MISKQELINKINDPKIYDEVIFGILKEYCTDRYDASGNIIPLTDDEVNDFAEVSGLAYRVRPKVMEMLRLEVVEEHKDCCCDKDLK